MNYFSILFLFLLVFLEIATFSEETVEFEILEDAKIGTIIGKVDRVDGYSYRLSRGNSKIQFNPETLEISTISSLDHETEKMIDLLVITSPPSIIHLQINILDINDNDPHFSIDPQMISIPETAPIGWRVSLSGAIDPDTNKSIQIYGLEKEEEEEKFRIIQTDGLVFLEVIDKLDRELVDEYSLRLIATDDGVPSRSSSCLLKIEILDTNDNFPTFLTRSIDLEYPSGKIPSKIFRLNATDADAGENGEISYEIVGISKEYFEISDGWVEKKKNNKTNVDEYCKKVVGGTCKVTIEASDHGTPPLVSFLDLRIQVDSKRTANNNEPNINIRFYPADHDYIIVQPDDVNGKTLAILSITDPDGPIGPNSTIRILSGNEEEVFSLISRSNINILTLRQVEKAEKSKYEIVFEANDDQQPVGRLSKKMLRIFLKKNAGDIKISVAAKMNLEISSNLVKGSYVGKIPNNCSNQCTFELEDNPSFSIEKSTGIITTRSDVVLPKISKFQIRTLLPPPSDESTQTFVTIRAGPEKLEKIHLRRTYQFSTWQNATTGDIVGTLPRASTYSSLDEESSGVGIFPDGTIYLSQKISGSAKLLRLSVKLQQGNTTQKSTVNIIVRKIFETKLKCDERTFEIKENQKAGSIIGSFDQDQIVFYDLLDRQDLLFINGASLITRKSFDAEKSTKISFSYRVISPRGLEIVCNSSVRILDENDSPPRFSQPYYEESFEDEMIVSSLDDDVTLENRRVQYRLLNHFDKFKIDPKTGKIFRNFPSEHFSRVNLSIEAINGQLTTRTFALLTKFSKKSQIIWKSAKKLRIYRNDLPGGIVYKLEIQASQSITWKFAENETRFGIDSMGNVKLFEFYDASWQHQTQLQLNDEKYEMEIEYIEEDRDEFSNAIEKMGMMEKVEIGVESKVVRVIPEIAYYVENGMVFLENQKVGQDVFVFIEGPLKNRTIHMQSHHTFHPQKCQSNVLLISKPGAINVNCSMDYKLLTSVSNILPNMTITNIEESVQTLDLVTSTGTPFTITLIRNQSSDDVKFSSTNVLMLVSSSHALNVSIGRVTAESAFRIRYYLIDTSQVTIDADTGELYLRERFYRNINDLTLVAVVPTGIVRAKLTIEVVEDYLHIETKQFVIFTPSRFQINQPVGHINVGRDDVLIDVIDQYFYIRNNQLFIKQLPLTQFYELEGIARKSKLSTMFNITIVTSHQQTSENDLEYSIEELMPSGSVIGTVPNPKSSSKYRLIDMNCGLLIDSMGVIRSSQIFNRSETLNITTKMIETTMSKIWNIYVKIEEVNNNSPKIVNPPKQLYLGDEYGLMIEDEDGSDIFMQVISGDPMNQIDLGNDGKIRVRDGDQPFNATIRIYDQQPPFKYNFKDISIDFIPKHPTPPKCFNQTISIFGKFPKNEEIIGKVETTTENVTFRSLNSNNFDVNSITGEIMVRSENFENPEILDVEVRSYDGAHYSSCQIYIEFDYIQEIFDNSEDIIFNVTETSLPGSEIGRINVTNAIFEIENDDNFTISSFDGIVSINSPLDFETIQQYQITVLIHTVGSVIRKNVSINVINKNDEIPRFITGDIVYLSVLEEQPSPLIIGSSIAEDLDDSIITYSIVSGNTSLFAVNSTSGQITSLYPIDREKMTNYELEIEAKDGEGNYDVSKIIINVEDVNDNSPIFEQNVYVVNIVENCQIGTKIIRIKADDQDEHGENSRISYSMEESTQFRIDEATGWISVVGKIDYETTKQVRSLLTAMDHGVPRKSSQVPIIFNVLDENDNSPVIQNAQVDVYIPSDVKKGDLVFVVDVRDDDHSDELSYNVLSRDFEINSIGEVRFVKHPGNLKVIVEDSAKHATSKMFKIQKHSGKFPKFENIKNTKIKISEGVRQKIGAFEAKGSDLTYGLVESNKCRGYFLLDNFTIFSTEIIDREHAEKCDIWIGATGKTRDGKNLTSWLRIEVEIMDVNDNIPMFEKQLYRFKVKENGGEGMEIGTVKALDRDKNDRITYRIISGDIFHEFVINDDGKIEAIRDLDRETIQQYRLIIEASDSIHLTNTTALIDIMDEDDNAPRFSRIFHAEIEENAEIDSFVVQISASDADLDENHHFFLEDDEMVFRIDEMTGNVYTKELLDYEKKSSYRLKVRLQDGVWSIETSVFITILNVNDNPPIFENSSYIFVHDYIDSKYIGKVLAFDQDPGSTIQYSIDNPNFHINSMGEIEMSRNIDVDSLEMLVTASDSKYTTDVNVIVIFKFMWNVEKRKYDGREKNESVVGYFEKNSSQILPNNSATINDKNELILSPNSPEQFYILNAKNLIIYTSSHRKNVEKLENLEIEIPSFTEIGDIIGKIDGENVYFEENSKLEIDENGNIILRNAPEKGQLVEMVYNDGIWPKKDNKTMEIRLKIMAENMENERNAIIRQNEMRKMRNIQVSAFENSTEIMLNMINEQNCVVNSEFFEYSPSKLLINNDVEVGTHQLSLSCSERILIDVNILPIRGELQYPKVIFSTKNGFSIKLEDGENSKFYLADDNLRGIFDLSENGHLKNKETLMSGIYRVPINIKKNSGAKKKHVIRVISRFLDNSTYSNLHVNVVDPPKYPMKMRIFEKPKKCESKMDEISDDCQILIEKKRSMKVEGMEISIDFEENRKESIEAVEIEVICMRSSIAKLIVDLRKHYDDMKINIHAVSEKVFDLRYILIVSIIDRNGKTIDSSETRRTLRSYFDRVKPFYIELIRFRKDICGGKIDCKIWLKTSEPRVESRFKDQIFNFPSGKLTREKWQEIKEENKCGKMGKPRKNDDICQCSSGFESSTSCDNELTSFSIVGAGIIELKTRNLSRIEELSQRDFGGEQRLEMDFRTRKIAANLMMVNFEKQRAKIEILDGFVKFTLSDSSPRRVTSQPHIELQIDRKIDDGKWHRLKFSMQKKRMTIQIDGKGKEMKSRINLSPLFSSQKIIIGPSAELCLRRIIAQNNLIYPPEKSSEKSIFDYNSTMISQTCPVENIDFSALPFNSTVLIGICSIALFVILTCVSGIFWIFVRKWRNNKTGWEDAKEIDAYAIRGSLDSMGFSNLEHFKPQSTPTSKRYQKRSQGQINMAYF